MAARAYPTKWQCHQCQGGPHLFAVTTHCTNVLDNGIQCAHMICDQCKSDKPIPSSSGIGAFEWEQEPQMLRATLEDRAPSNQSTSDVVSSPHLVKSDRDVAVHSLPSDSIPAISFDLSSGEFQAVDLLGYPASDVFSIRTVRGAVDTGAGACLIAERVASGFGTDQIDSSKQVILKEIGQNEVRTIGQIKIAYGLRHGGNSYYATFHVVPDRFVRGRFDVLLSARLIPLTAFSNLGIFFSEKHEGIHEGSERLDKEYMGMAAEREGLDEETTSLDEEQEGLFEEYEMGETSVHSSASELNRTMFPAGYADPKSPRHLDSDEESMAQSIFSANSEDTIITSTDFSEETEEATAAQMFFQFIAHDGSLRPLFEEAREQSGLLAKDFEATMRVLLKKFARELRSEAETEMERKAVPFLSQRAGFVARGLASIYYWQDEASDLDFGQHNAGQTRLVANEHHLEDGEDEDEDDDEVSTARSEFRVLFSPVREFLSSSAAFAKLHETLRRLLSPEQLSWAIIRDQWQRELGLDFPVDLQQDCSIEILTEDKINWVDKFKSALEEYSGEEWLWEPFRAPRRRIPKAKVRLQWQCVRISAHVRIHY